MVYKTSGPPMKRPSVNPRSLRARTKKDFTFLAATNNTLKADINFGKM